MSLLQVSGLKTYFPFGSRWFGKRAWVRAVDGVDLTLERGEVLQLRGRSYRNPGRQDGGEAA